MIWFCGLFATLLALYGLHLGSSSIPPEARQTWSPQDLESLQEQLNATKSASLIVLVILSLLFFIWII